MSQPWARRKARSARVALVPGMITRSASPGSGASGRHEAELDLEVRSVAGRSRRSWRYGQQRRDDLDLAPLRPWPGGRRTTASSAGRRRAAGIQGRHAAVGPAGAANDLGAAVGEQAGVAAELVDQEAVRSWRVSSGSSTRVAPTRAAMTWPRSISPTSTTGTPAARAKPILAMSPLRRLISAGLPAPSTIDQVCSRPAGGGSSPAPRPAGRPCGPGRRVPSRSRPSGRARRAGRRRRSEASAAPGSCGRWRRGAAGDGLQRLGAADLAAVDGDGGVVGHVLRLERAARSRPRLANRRQRPATSTDLPTSDPHPRIISAAKQNPPRARAKARTAHGAEIEPKAATKVQGLRRADASPKVGRS